MKVLRSLRSILFALVLAAIPASSYAGVFISVAISPPVLPVYVQPPCPQPGWMWTPGYWAYGEAGYYWVPGTWVPAPYAGALWTPGYWGFASGLYAWHPGYWGPHVGYYGGVNYGFGYVGVGFFGGVWAGGAFRYNTAVTSVNTTVIHNTYIDKTVINNNTYINNTHVAYSGGPGGVNHPPTPDENRYMHEQHVAPSSFQTQHETAARADTNNYASHNGGHPANVAMARPMGPNGRFENQQGRIANGVSNGQLTAGETKNLESREGNINREVRTDRQANGGTLTPQERQQVNQQHNNLSGSIYNDKHNANTAQYGNNEVGDRRYNQQQRIANGIRNGSMNANQASHVEQREQNINRSIAADRAGNGGKMTPQERQNINQRQNSTSRQIYNDKHGK